MLVAHNGSGSHTKEGTCLVKCPSPNVVVSCRPSLHLHRPPLSLYFASALLSFRPSKLAPLCAAAHPRSSPLVLATPCFFLNRRKERRKRKHQSCRIRRREWPCATNANSSSRTLRQRGASASSSSRSTKRCSRWWWTGWGGLMRAMMISPPAYLLTSAATRCLILTSSLMRTARRARFSSFLGLLTHQR